MLKSPALLFAALLMVCGSAAQAQAPAPRGAEMHTAKGIPCAACHGAKNEVAYPNIDQCTQCHNPEQLAEKTKDVKPQSPHSSPHYGNKLDCALCHLQHSAPENYCAQCHSFKFNVK